MENIRETLEKIPEYNISKSLLIEADQYFKGNVCGKQFIAMYITKTHDTPKTGAKELGKYFEYKATGSIPRDKKIPEPETTKAGKLTAEYQRALAQSEVFKKQVELLGIEIIKVGKSITKTINGVKCKLVTDFIGKFKGLEVVFDLKFSKAYDDKWGDFGWHIDSIPYKPHHVIHGVHYHWMTGLPVVFWIFNANSDFESKMVMMNIDPERVKIHEQWIQTMKKKIELELATGMMVRPELKRCSDCPLFKECEHRALTPTVYNVDISTES